MAFEPIKEENYNEIMLNDVEPFLKSLRTEGKFKSFDNNEIYYEYYITENPKASVVVSHGFTESAEKFREVYYYFLKEGYNVFSVDHRGHGYSYRPKAKQYAVNLKHFNDYSNDIKAFVDKIVIPASNNLPLYLYSHSMGGAVAVRFLEDYPGVFKKAVLSSPMVCADTGMSVGLAGFLGHITHIFGFGGVTVPGRGEFNPDWTYENSNDTSKCRYDYYHEKRIKIDAFKTSGPTFNWVNEAMKNTKYIMKDNNIKRIDAEVLLCRPEEDKMVLKSYQDDFIKRVKNATKCYFPNSRHEIYNSTNDVLLTYYPALFEFLS